MAEVQIAWTHQATTMEWMKDSDASITKRDLEPIHVLMYDSNVKPLAKELTDYLEVSDLEFKDFTKK